MVGVIRDPVFLKHNIPGHPESPERLRAIQDHLDASGLLAGTRSLRFEPATREQLLWLHAEEHLASLERACATGRADFTIDTLAMEDTCEAAYAAAGACIAAAKASLSDECPRSLCLVRPPGHHAGEDLIKGFCFLNNVALAAEAALRDGAERIAIVDFDVHHGNGTQELFYHRRDVLYTSIHEHGLFPGTGSYDEVGVEEGAGYTINVPLVRGAGDAHYARVMQELLAPALREFQPDLILVSAGYDSHHAEPLAEMDCSARAFYDWTALLARTADETCAGRLVLVLEGGYSLTWLGPCVENSLRALLGRGPSDIADRSVEPHPGQREMIESALELVLKTHRERLGL